MTIDHVHLRRLDLNLLLAFDALMTTRSVTGAAQRLGLSQSAMSHALARLREVLGDALVIREGTSLAPTETAEALAVSVREALLGLEAGLAQARGFDPTRAERVFTLAVPDYIASAIGPPLARDILHAGPGLQVRFEAYGRETALAALKDGTLDIYLGVADPPDWADSVPGYQDSFRTLYDPAAVSPPADLASFAAAPHALVAQQASFSGWVDRVLAEAGYARRVAVSTASFADAAACVPGTGLLLTAPSRAVARLAGRFDLATVTPPLPGYRFQARLFRHRRAVGAPAAAWIWARVRDALAGLEESPAPSGGPG